MPITRFAHTNLYIALCQELAAQICKLYLRLGSSCKITIHLPPLRRTTRYIIASNHQSVLDPFVIFAVLGRAQRSRLLPLKFMTIPKIYHRWWVKPFAYLLGCFPAHTKDYPHPTTGVEGSLTLLNQGYNICIFPEGTRTLHADSHPKNGICRILQANPKAELLLAHLEWTPQRRDVSITLAQAPKNIDKNDPKAIMKAIYEL